MCECVVDLQEAMFVCVETISSTACMGGWFSGGGGLLSKTISDGCTVFSPGLDLEDTQMLFVALSIIQNVF